MKHRPWYLIFVLASGSALTGCTGHSLVAPEAVSPTSQLRLQFLTPKTVNIATDAGATHVLEDVVEIQGTLMEIRGDSLLIRTAFAKFHNGLTQRFGTDASSSVAQADLRLEEIDVHAGRTIALVLALGAALLFLVAVSSDPVIASPPPKEDTEVGK